MSNSQQTELLAAFEKMLEKALQPINATLAEIKTDLQRQTHRIDVLEKQQEKTKKENHDLWTAIHNLEKENKRLASDVDRSKRISFAKDILLHGIVEEPNETWTTTTLRAQEFLTKKNLQAFKQSLDPYMHRLGPPRTPLQSTSSTTLPEARPRPIIMRAYSQSTVKEILALIGKHKSDRNSPYASAHLTASQILELKNKPRPTKRLQETEPESAPKNRRQP